MAIAQWDDSYRTGNEMVDNQHQQLFRLVNELHDAIMAKKTQEVLTPTLQKLAKYTVEHFRSEEALMRSSNYPGLSGHHKKHEDLTKEVKELVEKYASGQAVLSITLSNFLANWLRHHIKEEDMALIKFMQKQAPSMAASSHDPK